MVTHETPTSYRHHAFYVVGAVWMESVKVEDLQQLREVNYRNAHSRRNRSAHDSHSWDQKEVEHEVHADHHDRVNHLPILLSRHCQELPRRASRRVHKLT